MAVLRLQAESVLMPKEGMLATMKNFFFWISKRIFFWFLYCFLKAKAVLQFFLFRVIFDLCVC